MGRIAQTLARLGVNPTLLRSGVGSDFFDFRGRHEKAYQSAPAVAGCSA